MRDAGRATPRGITRMLRPVVAGITMVLAMNAASVAAGAESPLTVRFGISSDIFFDVSPKDAQVALEVWAKKIVGGAKRTVHASGRVLSDVDALAVAATREEFEVVALPTMEYLRLRDRIPVVPAFVGTRHDGPRESHVLLVRGDAGIARLSDLSGKRLILQSGAVGVMTRAWLDLLLAKHGHPAAGRFFGSIKEAPKASQAVLPVFFRQTDAAAVTRTGYKTMLEMNPQIERALVPLAESPKLLLTMMCLHRNAGDEIRQLVLDSVVDLENTATGRQLLLLFKVARVIPFEPAHLDEVSALFRDHRALRGGLRRG